MSSKDGTESGEESDRQTVYSNTKGDVDTDYASSGNEEEIDEKELQRFVLVRGDQVFLHDPFYVAVRTKKSSRIFGRSKGKKTFEKIWREKIRHAKGQLIPSPQKETLYVKGDQWMPIEEAEKMVDQEIADETQERFNKTLESILRPCRIFRWDAYFREAKESPREDRGLPEPGEDDPSFFLNMPQEELLKGPPMKGATTFSFYNGKPLVLGPSGICVALANDSNSPPRWYVASIQELTLGVADRVTKQAAQEELEDTRRWRKQSNILKERVETLEAELAQIKREKKLLVRRGEHVARITTVLSDEEIDDPDKELVVDVAKALRMPATKNIIPWGRDSKHKAQDWLRLGVNTLRSAGISGTIMWEVLITRLEPSEASELLNLKSLGLITNFSSFKSEFKERFCAPTTAMQRLREIQKATMSTSEVTAGEFYRFGAKLKELAHGAYKDMAVGMEHWKTLDEVVVVLGFLNGIPRVMAAELMKMRLTTLTDHMREAVFLHGVDKDTNQQGAMGGAKWVNGLGAQPKGAAGQPGSQQTGKKEDQPGGGAKKKKWNPPQGKKKRVQKGDLICPWCRVLDEVPEKCNHCRWCGEKGHFGDECRNPKKERPAARED